MLTTTNFNVGDRITGTSGNTYGFTTDRAEMKVIGIQGNQILVEITSHMDFSAEIGKQYTVDPQYFRLLSPSCPTPVSAQLNPYAKVASSMPVSHDRINANARKWLVALRSGQYKQTTEKLCRNGAYCCLGVACDLYIKDGGALSVRGNEDGSLSFDGADGGLPDKVQKWLGLTSYLGNLGSKNLATLNDKTGLNFLQIADVVEGAQDLLFMEVK